MTNTPENEILNVTDIVPVPVVPQQSSDVVNTKPVHQTGDWLVYDSHRLVARPWGEISWAIAKGALPAIIFAYLCVSNLTNQKPNKAIYIAPGVIGALISLYSNRKKFTWLERTEKFYPDKK